MYKIRSADRHVFHIELETLEFAIPLGKLTALDMQDFWWVKQPRRIGKSLPFWGKGSDTPDILPDSLSRGGFATPEK
ncbi:hypothetical protein GCM10007874_11900 [Labrys miyagiensis]|uniref:Uncharacterized protein n=1 Tax=Labrys miyagiensis TaxID=346912 RepID=A0ABQ6CDA1_9HYPH|nr:hypothetical protein GCM10007874_11900 [Labrys miyagiensis]